jgi:two-component system, cell cycle response regulator DivK
MVGRRVLIAEDDEKSMKLFREALQLNGFETLEATTGEQAVELATRHGPNLVLMDIQLDGMNGLTALRCLREDRRTASTPIVAVTAQAMAGDRERFLDAGFDDYISKPVNIRELVATIKRYCGGDARADITRDDRRDPD